MPARGTKKALNPFGFVTGKNKPWPDLQLRTALRLQNNRDIFKKLKVTILGLVETHLDIDYPPSEQTNGLDTIRAKLKANYPDIFATEESEKRLYFALRVAFHAHTSRRARRKQRLLQGDTITPSGTPRITRSRASVVRPESIQEVESGSENDDDCDYHETPPPPPPQSISRIYSRPNKRPIVLLNATPRNKRPIVLPDATPSSSSKTIMPSNTIIPSKTIMHCPTQYRPIYDFLEASKPPMTHLMDPFIDFGCINAEFLRAISSWSSEKIGYVLNQLPPGRDGRKITEMEKFILQNHFKDYFA